MVKIIETKGKKYELVLESLKESLIDFKEEIHIYYSRVSTMKKLEEEILDFFGSSPLEYGKVKFLKYSK
jgi:hypothetical protein